MVKETKIDFRLDAIGHLLRDKPLAVPINQRAYAWNSDEIDDIKNDLSSAFATTDPEYFLGTIVLSADGPDSRLTIVDGQQRLATTAMLLAAVRDEFADRGDSGR